MKTFAKILCLTMSIVITLSLLVSCDADKDGKTHDPNNEEVTTLLNSESETEAPKKETAMQKIIKRMQEDDNYLIISLGDSITQGQGASSVHTTYTAVFTKGLAERFPNKSVVRIDGNRDGDHIGSYSRRVLSEGSEGKITVVRSGIGGNTVSRLIKRKSDYTNREFENNSTADLFIISVGINDSIVEDSSKYVTPEVFKRNLNTLVTIIRQAHPGVDIIFLTPTWRDYGTEHKSTIDAHAAAMIEFANEQGIPYVDMHKMWMDHLVIGEKNFGQGDWLVDGGDRCHPSDAGHAAMAEELLKNMFEEN